MATIVIVVVTKTVVDIFTMIYRSSYLDIKKIGTRSPSNSLPQKVRRQRDTLRQPHHAGFSTRANQTQGFTMEQTRIEMIQNEGISLRVLRLVYLYQLKYLYLSLLSKMK